MSNKQEQLFKRNAKTFAFAASFLGSETASKVSVLYEFCRLVDNLADETGDWQTARKTLKSMKEDLNSGKSQDLYMQQLIDFTDREGIDKNALIELLEGVISDCRESVRVHTEDELIKYCAKVAGTVGVALLPILGVNKRDQARAMPFATQLGIAMQLTNMARDIKEDALHDRVYIPRDWLSIDESLRLTKEPQDQSQDASSACRRLLDLADSYYLSAREGYSLLPFSSRVTVLVAAGLYQAIGGKIRARGYTYWQGRVYLTKIEKLFKTALLTSRLLSPLFWINLDYAPRIKRREERITR
jgi:phytoene synthase